MSQAPSRMDYNALKQIDLWFLSNEQREFLRWKRSVVKLFSNKQMQPETPPTPSICSLVASNTQLKATQAVSKFVIKSVRDLHRHYCDPNNPCCAKRDPEKPLIPYKSRLRIPQCPPKDPHHFEFTILHRLKMKFMLRWARERQINDDLTPAQLSEIRKAEAKASTNVKKPTPSEAYFKRHPNMTVPPPKPVLVDADGLQNDLLGLGNMALAHEIALNKDFKLDKPDRAHRPLSPEIEFAIVAQEKYWKKMDRVLLSKDLKVHKETILQLFLTLKTMLKSTLLPHNNTVRNKIDQELDEKTLLIQLENDAFDFDYYMDFILTTLGSLCCSIRDQEILDAREVNNPARQVRRVMELMEAMNLDMANFIIGQSRRTIVKHCVGYERNKFAKYIALQYNMGNDPMKVTRDWVRRHSISNRSFEETIALAFVDILDWGDNEWPETLALDWNRFPPLRQEIIRVTVVAAMITLIYDYARAFFLEHPDDAKDPEKVQVNIVKHQRLQSQILDELNALITYEEIMDRAKFQEALQRCTIHACKVVEAHKIAEQCTGITQEQKDKIHNLLCPLIDLNHPVRILYYRHVKEWFKELVQKGGEPPIRCAHNLSLVASIVYPPVAELLRLAIYNRGVFDVVYKEIYQGNCPPPKFIRYPGIDRMDKNIANLLTKLDEFSGRTTAYRRSHIDPRVKPAFDEEGTPVVDKEYQGLYKPETVTDDIQYLIDWDLLENEPTLDVDHEGVPMLNIAEPDYMFGHTTEDLLQLMERENIIKANKLRRIKDRMAKELLHERVADNLPVFPKIWGEDMSTLQQEYCRLNRILVKGATPLPPGTVDQLSSPRREFPNACQPKSEYDEKEKEKYNEKGERIFYSRNRGRQFGHELPPGPPSEVNIDAIMQEMDGMKEEESDAEIPDGETPPRPQSASSKTSSQ